MSYARFLNCGVMLGYKGIVVGQFIMGDGILVHDALCNKIHRLHLLAYDEFMFQHFKAKDEDRDVLKKDFLQLWNDPKAGKENIKNQHEDNQHISFAGAPSPYNDKLMLSEFASIMFKNLVKLL
ncbi:hypothetical protein IWW34DRAFT_789246 [Fusarium oxysporum f. sp. albedinis]|nr:hypothetical protein FOMA001_g14003 [Fusarium oxysporum f. sp. matthiolae]KAI3579557.1 hypothetical protein IWW34DRAFT_789246 [Fusarium oxysporum f. sp. albedinis]